MLKEYNINIQIEEHAMEESVEGMRSEVEAMLEEAGMLNADVAITKVDEDEINGPKALLEFKPQRKTDMGQIESISTNGRTKYMVPLEDVLDDDGYLYRSPSHRLDSLKTHRRAPLNVQYHSGPYDLRIKELRDLPDDKTPEDYH